jgi:hypothetical protein
MAWCGKHNCSTPEEEPVGVALEEAEIENMDNPMEWGKWLVTFLPAKVAIRRHIPKV